MSGHAVLFGIGVDADLLGFDPINVAFPTRFSI